MKSVIKSVVTKEFDGKTLNEFLKFHINLSSSLIKKAKRIEKGITVNGKLTFVTENVKINDRVEVIIETDDEKSENIPLCDIPLDIVFEDENLLIINKQGNIPTHPSLNNYEKTVAGAVMNYYEKQGLNFVFRPVNRLDKGTSGLMVIAKNPHIHELLKNAMHKSEFSREYLAVVCGKLEKNGTVDAPIFREDNSIIKRMVDARGVSAVTHYSVEKVYGDKTLVSLKLETGRTHQIRVHMAYIGHALYGDFLYGEERNDLSRPALHSYKITLKNPLNNEVLEFFSPLPKDIEKIIKIG
ncbi:MAG: RluA family pseudouridine synthase [Clostridia bacterium]|nr:RluA family pseudouridine synthase [Clostridia bacterium]